MVLGLALASSVLLTAVVGSVLAANDQLALSTVVFALVAVTVAGVVVAAARRYATAPSVRRAPLASGLPDVQPGGVLGSRNHDLAFGVALAALVVAGGVTAVVAQPADDEAFSEFAVLQEDGSGELVASNYPDELVAGDGHPFHLLVENHEGHAEEYAVVVVAERVEDGEVVQRNRLDTVDVEVDAGERRVVEHEVVPEATGENVRVRFFLYKGEVPATATAENADIALQVQTSVVAGHVEASVVAAGATPVASTAASDVGVGAERVATQVAPA
jgi:uncharacterized membrane protein